MFLPFREPVPESFLFWNQRRLPSWHHVWMLESAIARDTAKAGLQVYKRAMRHLWAKALEKYRKRCVWEVKGMHPVQGKRTRSDKALKRWHRKPGHFERVMCRRLNSIMNRCTNPQCREYPNYGGRGITVTPEFHDSTTFVDYLRTLPNASTAYTIDRIDKNGNYAPGNLRVVSQNVQTRNTRCAVLTTFRGNSITVSASPAPKAPSMGRIAPSSTPRVARPTALW